MFTQYLEQFASSDKVQIIALIVVLDLLLGVGAAVKMGVFSFSKVAGFLRDDVGFKVIPYFGLWFAAEVAGDAELVVPGLDLALIEDGAYALVVVAMVGSILSSISDLGLLGDREAPTSLKGEND